MSDRTPEERERARLEREARRAARARGEKPPPSPRGRSGLLGGLLGTRDGGEDGAAAGPPREARKPEPPKSEPPSPAPRPEVRKPEPPKSEPPTPAPRPEVRRPEPPKSEPPTPAPRPEVRKPEPRKPEPRKPEPPKPQPRKPAPVPPRRADEPAAVPEPRRATPRVDLDRIRRLTSQRRAHAAEARGGDAAGKPPKERTRRWRGTVGRVLAGLVLLGVLAAGWLLLSIFQPFNGEGEGQVRVTIPTGSGVGDIGDILADNGVVSSATFFEVRATIEGARGDLKPGTYTLAEGMSYAAAIDALSAGPPNDVVQLLVPEGRSRTEVARLVEQNPIEGDYERATRSSRILDPRDYGAERARNLEGFLWPSTYELKRGATVNALVNRQLRAFRENFDQVSMRQARRANLTPYEVLIIASMVEREAMLDRERPVIASVIYNRLRRGEPLGIDATIRFATDNWTEPLTQSDLEIDSAYNTRTRQGLPPTPIGSPGIESIRAAADPADTDYLFYVVKPGTCGEHEFTETLEEFERAAARYNEEREARGGQSPTDCE